MIATHSHSQTAFKPPVIYPAWVVDVMEKGNDMWPQSQLSQPTFLHVWFVLIQEDTVIGWYTQREIEHRNRAVHCWRVTRGKPVRVYEVDANHGLPPMVGTVVDPIALGWCEIAI